MSYLQNRTNYLIESICIFIEFNNVSTLQIGTLIAHFKNLAKANAETKSYF